MKRIQAYTRTEDEAESLRTRLVTVEASNIEVGELEESVDGRALLFAPLATSNLNGSTYVGGVDSFAPAGVMFARDDDNIAASAPPTTDSIGEEADFSPEQVSISEPTSAPDDLRYVVAAKVEHSRYDEAVLLIREHGGYVETFD
ncbi:flagellar basal body rod protein [Paenibacillus apiarius]|uniref:Flagellar basal body rod protein n=1 Tax=Paenibacillus apiarius TaxID=46240 RepID=A0ABT4DXD6_9BACL|nr:flagellar basal body rod protein [Paenibacillus apiarius]MCY9512926.1 flagellar basal body rod protein [Paenibacillus apiarius]MCY9522025.1 flagellar basal body rod protein [Paenibacillus apiarius]MCY9555070.1 flagellar basal body rod protein [Paenibacillus apiarius]MCY9558090.1 flagellar basal body rod protein [Paenibacillus apiarius]MCY9686762.1 flagellar basal body rod protein [Paenibacillus apiarius]